MRSPRVALLPEPPTALPPFCITVLTSCPPAASPPSPWVTQRRNRQIYAKQIWQLTRRQNRWPSLNSRDGEQRAPAAGIWRPVSHRRPPPANPLLPLHHLPGGSLGRKVFLTGSKVGMGGWWEGGPFIPFPFASV